MKLSSLFIKLLVIFGIGLILLIGAIFFGIRTKVKNINSKFPYNKIVNTTLTTKQVCYIAKNYEHDVMENPYILNMRKDVFSNDAGKIYTLPIGTLIKIENANAYTTTVSGTTHNLVLGSVNILELEQDVAFEFYWGENPTYGLYEYKENYDIYSLAPWQKIALPYKYFWDGHTEPLDWKTWNVID